MTKIYRAYYPSPIGEIEITATDKELCGVDFVKGKKTRAATAKSSALKEGLSQIDEYFKGKRRIFELVLRLPGTDFQNSVWRALLDVGFGETASYREIAAVIGHPQAVRAVGGANGKNPIGIIIPCHRIIGSSGALVGYGGGLWRKKWLLDHEKKFSSR
jgi:methylated-DNA-[protein]-cysteine S-methyltransferase